MKYEKLMEYINNQDWENAVEELDNLQGTEVDDILAILAATVCLQYGRTEDAYEYIRKGLLYNYRNYELYFLLGNYYENINPYQACLCYENAEFYCGVEEDKELISQFRLTIEQQGVKPAQVSIVILAYNLKNWCMRCIESIRQYNPSSSYEIIVVDNASTDGIREWLQEQEDITLICNEENVGLPAGYNQGIEVSQPDYDILLLDDDVLLFPNSLFWLRMGLYEEEKIGAAGCMSNYISANMANGQFVEQTFSSNNEVVEYARTHNIPEKNALEKKSFLIGFVLLLKRKALNEVGLLDTLYTPGTYEDADLCVRLRYAGWKLCLCHNSFVFHYGQRVLEDEETWIWSGIKNNLDKFKQKWGFSFPYYTKANQQIISLINRDKESSIRVLEVGCGGAATLAGIQYLYPNAEVKGIELVEEVVRLNRGQTDVIQGNIETMQLPYDEKYFDYIIFGDVLEHLYEPEAVLCKMKPYLREGGQFLCSIPNIMHTSALLPLLKGEFRYQKAGILDRTHIRFFTLDSIWGMLHKCGLVPTNIKPNIIEPDLSEEDEELLNGLYNLPHIAPKEYFNVFQYVFSAGIADDKEKD